MISGGLTMNLPYITVENGTVIEVNSFFVDFIGYMEHEIVGKDVSDVFKVLRIAPKFDFNSIGSKAEYFLFTNTLDYRNVKIHAERLSSNRIKYIFSEIQNSRFENKFVAIQRLLSDEHFGIGVYSSPDLILIKANQVYLDILDEPFSNREATIGLNMDTFVDWEKVGRGHDVFFNVINTGSTYYGKEIKGITGSWKNNYFDNTIIPVIEDGIVRYVISMIEDVTERVLNRQKIEEQAEHIEKQKRQLQVVVENISDGLFILNKDQKFSLLNAGAREFFYNCDSIYNAGDELEHTTYYDVHGGIIPLDQMPGHRVLEGESIRQIRITCARPDGTYHYEFSGSPVFDENGNVIKAVLCSRNVTEQVEYDSLYKQAVERQLDILNKIIQSLDLPFVRLSYPDLAVLDVNQKGFQVLQTWNPWFKTRDDIIGDDFSNMLFEDEKNNILSHIQKAVEEKKTSYMNNRKREVSGEEVYINTLLQPILGLNGEVEEVISVNFDVTSEVKANMAMDKLLKQQEEFFANISHELKTPLNLIYSTVQLFDMYCKEGSLDEKRDAITKYIGTITQNCYRLSKLINNIVDLSKIEAGFYQLNKSNQNIVSVIEETVMSVVDYTRSKGLNIIFDTDTEEKIINCDPEKVERVILNLISNAIKFSDAGGEICVSISDRDDYVEIEVKDNGIGIDKSHIDKIFDRFNQVDKSLRRNAEGSGIGLSLVKSIVELHGGKVLVESELGHGSKFTLLLPMEEIKNTTDISESNLMRNNKQIVNIELSDI